MQHQIPMQAKLILLIIKTVATTFGEKGRGSDREGARRQTMCFFPTWLVITQVCLLCDNSLSCAPESCILLYMCYDPRMKKKFTK